MYRRIAICFLFALVTCGSFLYGQSITRSNVFSYNVNEGLLQTSIIDNAVDQNNFLWISYPNGIQKFDGNKFTEVKVQKGLPDDKAVNFFRSSNGHFFISHSKGISLYEPASDNFRQLDFSAGAFPGQLRFIGEDEGAVYFLSGAGLMYMMDLRSFRFSFIADVRLAAFGKDPEGDIFPANSIRFHRVIIRTAKIAALWDLAAKKVIAAVDMPPVSIGYFHELTDDHSFLFYDCGERYFLKKYDFNTRVMRTVSEIPVQTVQSFRSLLFREKNKTLYSLWNHLYETDGSLRITAEVVDFQNKPPGGNSTIARLTEDNYGNLYATTINEGFKKIIRNNYAVKYFGGSEHGKPYVLSILADKKANRVFAGTYGNGLMIFDTAGRLVRHIEKLPGSSQKFSVYIILKDPRGGYLFFCYGNPNAWKLSSDLSQITGIDIAGKFLYTYVGYYCNVIYRDAAVALISGERNILKVNFSTGRITASDFTATHLVGVTLFNGAVVTHEDDRLIFIDTATFQKTKSVSLKNTGGVRCIINGSPGTMFLGTNKGIFLVNGKGDVLRHLTKENGLPDECIYAMERDEKGLLWCSTNKGIFRLNADNSIFRLQKEDGLQENEFNTNVVAKADDGEIFFGGVNGISSFFPRDMHNVKEKINLLVTAIRINNQYAYPDTAAWMINHIELPAEKNSLSFDFIGMGSGMPAQYIYQYRMEGVDDRWIQNDGLQTVRYLLPPGTYTFQLYASRSFDKEAVPMKEIRIFIRPPFWRTWWFIALILLLFSALLIFSINRYNRRKYRRKLHEKENEYRLQLERERISRDLHDNIGAYANAVLYNTELLQTETEEGEKVLLMNDLRFASKDIITALRESVWALKKDFYTAREAVLRINNFIQPFSRYYPAIKFLNEEKAVPEITMHSTHALNLVRIIQEAVTNAIKHAGAKKIIFSSDVREELWQLSVTDDGKGFDTGKTVELQQGNGLNNLHKRAAEAGFTLNVLSEKGKGTSINVRISIEADKEELRK